MPVFVLRIKDEIKLENEGIYPPGKSFNPYTCFHGFVIVASSEEDARQIAGGYGDGSHNRSGDWWLDPEITTCQTVNGDGMPCVALADSPTG